MPSVAFLACTPNNGRYMGHRSTAVAATAIRLAIEYGGFRARDLRRACDDPPSESTITRILRQLEENGWLDRRVEKSDFWRAGLKAKTFGDMDERALEVADMDQIDRYFPDVSESGMDLTW